jgi:hypothetical protein
MKPDTARLAALEDQGSRQAEARCPLDQPDVLLHLRRLFRTVPAG